MSGALTTAAAAAQPETSSVKAVGATTLPIPRTQRARDAASEADNHRRRPVDIQIGDQVGADGSRAGCCLGLHALFTPFLCVITVG